MEEIKDPLNSLAEKHFGVKYLFPYQRLVISNIIEVISDMSGEVPPNQIVILPTGAGKSLCFMLPSLVLEKPTLVIFPLLGLIADQKRRLEEAGISTAVIKGGQSSEERKKVFAGIEKNSFRIILSNPETLGREDVIRKLAGKEKGSVISHVVIDEAHTVSEWGDTFRKAYLETGYIIEKINPAVVTAFTATASENILKRLKNILFEGKQLNIISANPDRVNISYQVIPSVSKEHDLIELAKRVEKPALVFTSSRISAELAATSLLKQSGLSEIKFYHAGLDRDEKKDTEDWFFRSGTGILTATCAYGLGVDKGNIRTVIHLDLPGSVEAYLQESGRGGRDRKKAQAIVLYSWSDRNRLNLFKSDEEKIRYKNLLSFAENNKTCRRKTLLGFLSAEPDFCDTCDICSRTHKTTAAGEKEIITLVKNNNRMLTVKEASAVLKGSENCFRISDFIRQSKSYGVLSGWSSRSIEEGIQALIEEGKIKKGKLLYRNLLSAGKRSFVEQDSTA